MAKARVRKTRRQVRHKRVRRKVFGWPDRPRMAVFRSLNNIYVQVIDDTQGHTLVAASSLESDIRAQVNGGNAKSEVAALVGSVIAERALDKGIKSVVFDRGGFKYHGRAKALADAARKGGLVF
ncbi:MAG: 50S ribosomal protein L18 [Dehalococcoidia bacterium]|nr:50S ribosomal protein L18 [Dehalococcoidia bacterium]